LDLRSGELRKSGRRVRLQAQPFQLLTMLLEHAGEVVTREEACRNLWPNDTFVDFDHSLAEAIGKIRGALGDSAENPKYIETLPKRGYRFIGKITPEAPAVMPLPQLQEGIELQPVSARVTRENDDSNRTGAIGKTRQFTRQAAFGVAFAALAIAISASWFFPERPHPVTAKDTIVLADFTNTTGDAVFDGALRQGLSAQLEQSPVLSIVPDDHIQETLQMMRQKPDVKLTPEISREVCQRTSAAAVLDGSIAQIGGEYLLTLNAVNCWHGDVLASTQVRAGDKNHVLDALGRAASEIRRKLGESRTSIEEYDVPLEQATTSSLEALKLFSVYARGGGLVSPVPILERVVELDPKFAAAYVQLSGAAYDAGEAEQASQYAQKAFDLRDRVSERERLAIEATYYGATQRDSELELRSWEVLQQIYPRDWGPWNDSAVTRQSLGDYTRALKDGQEALRLDPHKLSPYLNVGSAFLCLGRSEEAKQVAKQALAQGFDMPDTHILIYWAAFLDGDAKEMEIQMEPLLAKEGEGAFDPLWEQATTEAYFGRLKNSRAFSKRALEALTGKKLSELRAMIWDAEALREAEFGDSGQAKKHVAAALALSSGRNAKILTALALARAGDANRAELLANELSKQFSSDTLLQRYWLPTIRGAIELARNNPSRALDAMKGASYELGNNELLAGNLYPVYIRGQAYLGTHQGRESAAEFQRFLDHRSIVFNSPLGALAHLGLARAYSIQSEKSKARSAYQEFLSTWKDADPDIPILKQAKAEYAKLQ
jgi:DNA-binding winged helix-turn-helix (wHTH) protein/predicted Zn-dependent protease